MRAISALSSHTISVSTMDQLVAKLQGERDGKGGWILIRNGRAVEIEMGTKTMEALFSEEDLQAAGELLGAPPQSRVVFLFDDTNVDQFEYRMAQAVAKAMAEQWPVVIDDHTGRQEIVTPPGVRKLPE